MRSKQKNLLKLLRRLIKQEHLYTPEKLREMKVQLRELEQKFLELETQTSKGFGKK